MRLPLLEPRNRIQLLMVAYGIFSLAYLTAGNLHFFVPQTLPLTLVDREILFLDWTILIYFTQLLIICSPYLYRNDYRSMNETLYGMLIATFIAFIVFMLFPTTLPRTDLNPSPNFAFMYSLMHSLDQPVNCFPSLHVALANLAWTSYLRLKNARYYITLVWASLITLSTMTTGQHYFLDVIAGYVLTCVSYFLARQWVDKALKKW